MSRIAHRPDWTGAINSHLEALRLTPTRAREIADELAQHLDDRYHELRASGVAHEQAVQESLASAFQQDRFERGMAPLRQARAQADFAANGSAWSGFLLDVRHALRRVRKDRGVALATVLALALAIGAATTVVTATYAIVLKPLDYTDPARVVNLWLLRSPRPNWHFRVPVEDFDVIERSNQAFAGLALYDNETMKLTGGDFPEEVSAGIVSAKLFTVLGVRPAAGRDFVPADERDDSGAVAIVSDRLWQRRFGGGVFAPDANVRLNGSTYRIIGVMPRGFGFPEQSDLWLPRNRQRAPSNGFVVARLRPAITVARAQSEMEAMVTTITGGRSEPGMAFTIEPIQRSVTSPAADSWFLLTAAVGCVLAIGWVNVSNLQLAKGLHLQKEIQLRFALGATRGRIIRLLASESLVLAVLGGTLAVLVATLGIRAIQMWAPLDTPRLEELRAGQAVVWIALALSLLSALASGLLPALQCSRSASADGGRLTTATRRQSRARNLLVVFEIAMAIVLLSAALQLARSLMRLTDIDPGFQTTHLLTVSLPLQGAPTPSATSRSQFVEQVAAGIESLPGVISASASSGSVLRGWGLVSARRTLAQRISVEGWTRSSHDEADMRRITAKYFSTLGMRVLEGRPFTDGDRHGGAAVAIVNETLANAYWSGQSPIGKRLAFDQSAGRPHWREIVGVVNDTRNTALTEPARPEFYVPLTQDASGFASDSVTLYVRTSRAPLAMADEVRARVWSIDRDQAIPEISTMEMAVDRFVAGPRFRTIVLSGLAGLGLMLTVVGVYAVMSFVVGQRDREMAIRLALGSDRAQIARLVLSLGCRLAAAGIVAGIAASLLFARLLRGVLFDAPAVEPGMLGAVSSVVMAVVLLASYGPARRAANTEPADVLRPG